MPYPTTVVVRHPKENLKKCSLRHLEGRPDFLFLTADDDFSFDATGYVLLEIGAEQMSAADASKPILLLDSTWKLLPKIKEKIRGKWVARGIPSDIKTAYPRVSKLYRDPEGLATVEALYAALKFAGRPCDDVLDGYHFAAEFLEKNGWAK